ncbi:MAG TPA: extracellular solute-binding protein [Thermomicrobiales bacterium]|nr:extracellular solute-binding protein [Thermomicrobiales bacterium]
MEERVKPHGLNRREFLLAAAALPPAAALARPALASAQDKANIAMWFDTTGGAETANCIIATAVDPFNKQGNGITVKATRQANGWEATKTALAGGGGPDIVGTPGPSFAVELAKAGQILPLDDLIKKFGWGKRYVPWTLELGKVSGKIYSLPSELETLVLYYNKTVFEKNGWKAPKTIDELMKLAQQVKDAGKIPFAASNAEWRPANEWFVGEMLNHVAGPDKVYQALTGAIPWTDASFKTAIDDLNEIQQKGWFMGGLDRYYTATTDDRYTSLASGDAAMMIEGTWFMSDAETYFGKDAGFGTDWDWVPMPSTTGEAYFDVGIGSTYSINKQSKSPDAVATFLDYYFSPEMQAKLVSHCNLAPAPVNVPTDKLTGLDPRHIAILDAYNKALSSKGYGYTTWTFWPPKTETYLIDNIEKVWAGDMTTEQYLQGMQDTFAQEAKAGLVPPIPPR